MKAILKRGEGPRQWQSYRSTDTSPVLVFFRCPLCGGINNLSGATVMADGHVAQTVTCQSGCQTSYQLTLQGWGQAETHSPMAYVPSLCHDGDRD